ncbi:TlpA family protein disulfide reductase [Planctomycetota bacterium]|nr:TlpA family protein disulfide reductase [Planctomycetota bacterium]
MNFRAPLFTITALCLFISSSLSAQTNTIIPSYNLTPGQIFTWQTNDVGKDKTYRLTAITAIVLKTNPDNSYDLLILHDFNKLRTNPDTINLAPTGKAKILNNPFRFSWYPIAFPELRSTPKWQTIADGITKNFTLTTLNSADISANRIIKADIQTNRDKLYNNKSTIQWHFNPHLTIPQSINYTKTNYGAEITSKLSLIQNATLTPEQLKALNTDLEQFSHYLNEVNNLINLTDQKQTDEIKRLETKFDTLAANIQSSKFHNNILDLYKRAKGIVKDCTDLGKDSPLVGKPAPTFSFQSHQGTTYNLQDYKGKVVLLDFWFKRCGWCIVAMPTINDIVNQFKNKDVIVLGMNKGDSVKDIIRTEEIMNAQYESIQAQTLAQSYSIEGYPTFVIIDKQGIVQHVFVGFSPVLRMQLKNSIDQLLEK